MLLLSSSSSSSSSSLLLLTKLKEMQFCPLSLLLLLIFLLSLLFFLLLSLYGKWYIWCLLHRTHTVGCNYLSLPLILLLSHKSSYEDMGAQTRPHWDMDEWLYTWVAIWCNHLTLSQRPSFVRYGFIYTKKSFNIQFSQTSLRSLLWYVTDLYYLITKISNLLISFFIP